MKLIYKKCLSRKFTPQHVSEVGVYLPETSNISDFISDGIRTTLVEASPKYAAEIELYYGDNLAVTLHAVAIADEDGTLELYQRGASTFLSNLAASPSVVNDKYVLQETDKIIVPAKRFDRIDDGKIDLLSIDIEGGEWFVLKHLVSRPAVISVETHGKYYINPFMIEITAWMKKNDYLVWYKDKSDTVYVKRGLIHLKFGNTMRVFFYDVYLFLRRSKRVFKR